MIDKRYEGLSKKLIETIPWVKESGLTLIEAKERHVKLKIPKEKHLNHVGIVYAGSLFMMMEIAGVALMAVSYRENDYIPINKEMSVEFRKPGFTDMYCNLSIAKEKAAEMIAPIDKNGKGDWSLEIEATDENDQVCATAHCTYIIRKV